MQTKYKQVLNSFYRPQETVGFAKFYGTNNPNGTWTLRAYDRVTGTAGTLKSWTLEFATTSTDFIAPAVNSVSALEGTCQPQEKNIVANITDAVGVTSASLYYSNNNGTTWQDVAMTVAAANSYTATIPSLSGKVLYYVKAADAANNIVQTSTRYYENAVSLLFTSGLATRSFAKAPLPIPDNQPSGLTANVLVCGLPTSNWILSSVKIDTILHTRGRDLSLYLINANNDTVKLFTPNAFSATFRNVTFRDDAITVAGSAEVLANNAYEPQEATGLVKAYQSQANGNGDWKLWVADNVANVSGTLRRFTLEFKQVTSVKQATTKQLVVYPNPAGSTINITLGAELKGKVQSIAVVNTVGQVVAENLASESINVSHLSSGVYMIRVMIDNQIFSQKITVNQ